jgi:putative tricarboxylic transport membrane protein
VAAAGGSLVALALAIFAIVRSVRLGVWAQGEPGAGLFPLAGAVVLAVLSLASLVELKSRPDLVGRPPAAAVGKVVAYAVGLALYGVVFVYAGHAAATVLVFVPLFRFVERLSWTRSVAIAAVSALVTYVVFERLLRVSLPRGWL